jgi:hypothetical protein
MKKMIIFFGVILIFFVASYFASRYIKTKPFITEQQAIEIAAHNGGTNIANVQTRASFTNGTWEIIFSPKQSTSGVAIMVMGGRSQYLIDGQTGAVVSRKLSP